ncbi:unnamed protein product [Meloidogyne enterolobii]|uniref:Uncharacterized protein n=1 Tax=Meloidogyne enterolobii TaxID=390850 RepID=A0ACB0YSZ7_MELEN
MIFKVFKSGSQILQDYQDCTTNFATRKMIILYSSHLNLNLKHGVCEVPTKISSCLMLDHPKSGLHYACSTNANLGEGECVEKKSKTGANVKVCSCYSSDFCNFKIWPDGQELEEQNSKSEEEDDDDGENSKEYEEENKKGEILNTNNSINLKYSFLIIFILNLFFYFILIKN